MKIENIKSSTLDFPEHRHPDPLWSRKGSRPAIMVLLVLVITALHYGTEQSEHHVHLFYQELYFLPLIIAAFWWGLKGALATSISVTVLYIPFTLMNWNQFCLDDFGRVLAILVYNIVAVSVGFVRDREKAEEKRLCEKESLIATGRAMACVAHDMKTPLIAIGGFTNLVAGHISKCPHNCHKAAVEKLGIVTEETRRLENLVKEMLDFASPVKLDLSTQNLNRAVTESVSLCEHMASEKQIRMVTHLPCSVLARIDAKRMKQALINLLTNAIQASPPAEEVRIKLSLNGSAAIIEIIDRGSGISPDNRERICIPFFTTRKDGTGLGLPIAKNIIEAHRGRLQFINNPDKGTTVRFSLPL